MEIGWYHEFHRQVANQSDTEAFAMGLDQVRAADEWGLDAVWLAEIHQQGVALGDERAVDGVGRAWRMYRRG